MCSDKDQSPDMTPVHLDIIQTDELMRQNTLDEVENKLDMASGTLQFAIEHSENKAFFSGINEHIKQALSLLEKIR